MARKGKPGKASGPPQPPGKRRKKSSEPARRSASASSSGSSGAASPRGEAATATAASASSLAISSAASATGSGAGTPSAHGKECDQCGNCMALDGVTAARAWPSGKKAAAGSSAAAGCQICDFVAFRKSQRPCVGCARAGCDHFCDWCGHGFHAKCARQRGEHVSAPDGFCCRKCEAEQDNPGDTSASEDDGDAVAADEPGARCGACRRPFNGAAPVAKASPSSTASTAALASGFRVNQSVLVDNEDMLYNAVITAVDAKGERIKIHFTRWSKSFDDWYAMDDERINESLACDCCNQWFHIGCLPPIKSSGRWKESTYVCPACIEDARAFHNGSRAVLKAKAAYISTSLAIANSSGNTDKADGKPKPRKATEKPDKAKADARADAEDDKPPARPAKRKRKLSEASTDSPRKRKEPAPALSKRSASSSRPASPQSPAVETSEAAPEAPPDADASPPAPSTATPPEATAAEVDKPATDGQESAVSAVDAEEAPVAATATDAPAPSPRADSPAAPEPHPTSQASPESAKAAEAPKSPPKAPSAAAAEAPSTPNKAPTPVPAPAAAAGNEQTPPTPAKPAEAAAAADEMHRRRGSGHSMSSLLNSPAPDEERPALQQQQQQPAFKPTVASLPMILPHRPSPETIKRMVAAALPPPAGRDPVKLERDLFPTAGSASARGKAGAKKEPAARSRAGKKSAAASTSAAGSARGSSLSAFDILRAVATQSMSGEVADAKPKRERSAPTDGAAAKRAKTDAATSTSSPSLAAGSGEADRPAPRMQMNSFVDLHFNIRKEMYLRFCRLEDEGLLSRDAAHLLRALIYPTSERFQDLKFVYLVNKDLPSDQLTKRLLEVVPGGKGPAALAASLLPPPGHGHHLPPGPHRSVSGGPLGAMPLFAPGVPRNVSPAGTPRMGLLPHGASLTDRLAESAIRSPLRSAVVSGPAPIPGSIKSDAKAAGKRPDLLMMDRPGPARPQPQTHTQTQTQPQTHPQAPPPSVPNQASRAGAPLISR